MQCKRCKSEMENIAEIAPKGSNDLSSIIFWCPSCGTVCRHYDWSKEPDWWKYPASTDKGE